MFQPSVIVKALARKRLLPAVLAAMLCTAAPAAAEIYTVKSFDDNVGVCSETECTTIRAALRTAGASPGPDTIVLLEGTYQLAGSRLDVDSDVTITGAGIDRTVIRGDQNLGDRVFFINAVANATLSRLTMQDGGGSNGDGGNLLNAGGTVVLDHVRVTNGSGANGGGLANHNGVMTVRQSLIDTNEATEGAGILNYGGAGAPGRLTVRDSTIASNTALYRGGGIASSGNASNTTVLERVTITRNDAGDGVPGGVRNDPASGGTLRVQGSIISGNTAFGPSDCSGPVISEGGNVSIGTDCTFTAPGDLQGVDPQLPAAPAAGVYPPAPGSPAVERFACTGADQRDVTRPQGAACDAGAAEVDREPDTVLGGDASGFTFASPEPGVTFECAISGVRDFAPCAAPYVPTGLGPGTYTLLVRAVDAGGRPDPTPAALSFTVAAPPPTPTPTPTPTPVFNSTVVVKPVSGRILVKQRGSSKFVELEEGAALKLGSEVDTRKGRIELTSLPSRGGTPQTAVFYSGIFRIGQAGGYTELRLTEKLAPCPKPGKARAAAKKPKTRKLWGDGKGKFRTRGQYSAATVRGTKWLVQDGCRYTRTQVTQGVVSVRDDIRKRTIVLRKGKSYTARPRR